MPTDARGIPMPLVACACGSPSTSKTCIPETASAAERLTAVVDLPTPPFWFAIAITRPINQTLIRGWCGSSLRAFRLTGRNSLFSQRPLHGHSRSPWVCGRSRENLGNLHQGPPHPARQLHRKDPHFSATEEGCGAPARFYFSSDRGPFEQDRLATRPDERKGKLSQRRQRSDRPSHNHIKLLPQPRLMRRLLRPRSHHLDAQLKRGGGDFEEGHLPGGGLQQRYSDIRPGDLDGNAGEAGAAADVQHRRAVRDARPQAEQGIQDVQTCGVPAPCHRGEPGRPARSLPGHPTAPPRPPRAALLRTNSPPANCRRTRQPPTATTTRVVTRACLATISPTSNCRASSVAPRRPMRAPRFSPLTCTEITSSCWWTRTAPGNPISCNSRAITVCASAPGLPVRVTRTLASRAPSPSIPRVPGSRISTSRSSRSTPSSDAARSTASSTVLPLVSTCLISSWFPWAAATTTAARPWRVPALLPERARGVPRQ